MASKLPVPGPVGFAWEPTDVAHPVLISAATGVRHHGGLSGRISHPAWVLDYSFLSGMLVRVGSTGARWRDRPARVAHLYPPGEPYWEDSRPTESKTNSAWVIFQHGECAGLDRLTGPSGFAAFEDPKEVLGSLLSEIARNGQALGRPGRWKVQSLFSALLHELLSAERLDEETYRAGGPPKPSPDPPWVRAVRDFLRVNLSLPIRLSEIAREVNVSTSTLTHRYIRETGETPMKTLARFRITVAKSLLLRGYPLKHIAPETGFCDEYHLSKAFKRIEGLSPRKWLESQRAGRGEAVSDRPARSP
jgi:AraC-like DNA-binding protein